MPPCLSKLWPTWFMNLSQMDSYQGVQASPRQPLRAEVFMSSLRSGILKPIQCLGFSTFNKTNLDVDSCKVFFWSSIWPQNGKMCKREMFPPVLCVYTCSSHLTDFTLSRPWCCPSQTKHKYCCLSYGPFCIAVMPFCHLYKFKNIYIWIYIYFFICLFVLICVFFPQDRQQLSI